MKHSFVLQMFFLVTSERVNIHTFQFVLELLLQIALNYRTDGGSRTTAGRAECYKTARV
jgi:hypothetical protein